ncbi:unnamed protein product [Zymoseptoria tritici ST99CH_3D1]|nr:unnamed protein product [Zymoseptoria tritici ST99CH_3D1]
MSSNEEPTSSADAGEGADLARAFQALAKGERAAAVLEQQLNSMESKIEALLAEAEDREKAAQQLSGSGRQAGPNGSGTQNAQKQS